MLEHTLSEEEHSQIVQTIEMFEVITQTQPDDYQSLEILKEAYQKVGRADDSLKTSRRLAEACFEGGVRRVVHVSSLGASESAPSMYLRSKARGGTTSLIRLVVARGLRPCARTSARRCRSTGLLARAGLFVLGVLASAGP